ncbi:Asp-tRNA(Asn)/Glu-tRNA(Gln) amidotransferase subunit GatB [Peptococcus niger]|uniref:Aspartyl/glutamyl-tRNA(Asn/Gln) amidotransferase subunit B n=1 Tax=Peptococcus niger TaxID=2741 RepID=A0A1G6RXZ4_PEPNI|nr:Asp-tRNA(Asn)/Glu-tRNA(Gln) amidotransferase subunit GatB [Peptococcus niger]SDD09291.1 aspartyl/glutamyl-tRNA(Asn/Gln) amidotransferase subunit B [Peptococcus niger]
MKYEPVIGLEVHVELKTKTKIFCGCTTAFGGDPNTHTCPVCLGLPGTLPVLNKQVLHYAILAGLATNCTINQFSKFDRKNYFYPDLTKAYQISQYDEPIAEHGYIDITVDGQEKRIGMTRIHMEEDAGKLVHQGASITASNSSLADYNRAGVPLIEIVSEPDMRSAAEARAYLEELKAIITYIGVSDAKMEEGSLRCDVNISLRPVGQEAFGTRAEIKNLNSFRAVERAIAHEIDRQSDLLDDGEAVKLETRTWDDAKGVTHSLRSKENADDYRYFPDPDLPPVIVTEADIDRLRAEIPELPRSRRTRFITEAQLPEADAALLAENRYLADFFESAWKAYGDAQPVANWLLGDVMAKLNADDVALADSHFTAEQLVDLLNLIKDGVISGKIAKDVFLKAFDSGDQPSDIVEKEGLKQISDTGSLEPLIRDIVAANPKSVADYKAGKKKALGFLVGQVMKETKGQANPGMVNQLLTKVLDNV